MDSILEQFYKAFIRNDRWLLYLKGLGNTLEVTIFAALIGIVLGTLACLFNMQRTRGGKRTIGSFIAYIYIDIIRGTPTMIQLLIMWNVIMASSKNKILVACMAFGINSGAYVAEILRGGIQSVDEGQMEAGRSLGLTKNMTMLYVVLPLAYIYVTAGILKNTLSVALIVTPFAIVCRAIGPVMEAMTAFHIVFPVAIIVSTAGIHILAFAITLVFMPIAFVDVAIEIVHLAIALLIILKPQAYILIIILKIIRALTMLMILHPLAFIALAVSKSIDTMPLALAFYIVAFILIAVFPLGFSFAMRPA